MEVLIGLTDEATKNNLIGKCWIDKIDSVFSNTTIR